ncbi:arylsulfatase [Rhodopirellula sp. MGV]|uniref:arylsulfatase n=1 Tax=Rhodopirellula sp. MGV TaxID=2023130 RepID=UPI000B96FE07|nr:arylsulfatase [Rhodopirellula sp. MGV]OYP33870.1 hypothetical protein CGZ80_16880 [Rhodopirellula sp. MGV]PNY37290.1 arylsulfatase [Rhodopirellula baltica]
MKSLLNLVLCLVVSLVCSRAGTAAERPNIILIVCDDMGFSDIGCYGSEIETPNLDRLARNGLRLRDFHNNAKCTETRASLLTGLWHHQTNQLKKPGNVTLAEVLGQAGYRTMMSGKWHLSGHPMDRGFDRYFGFLSGAINYFTGKDWGSGENLMRLDRDEYQTPSDFYSTDAFTDYAIEFLNEARQQQDGESSQPYFLYLAHNAPHFPLQAPAEAIAKYRGRYDAGWDKLRAQRYERQQQLGLIDRTWPLSKRDPNVEPFDNLTPSQQDFLIPMMEVYAAMVDRLDQNIGRLIDDLERHDELDNTLIIFFSDNGACPYQRLKSEGVPPGPVESDVAYDARWAHFCNTPLRLYKQYAHEGGTLSPMIVHWPNRITRIGGFSDATHHIVDLMPTFVELAGGKYAPSGSAKETETLTLPMEGISMLGTFDGSPQQSRPPIFWEFSANHAVRDGQWKLVAERGKPWELYDLSRDRTETQDLSLSKPAIVTRMAEAYDQWANRVGAKSHTQSETAKPSRQSQQFDLSSR